MKPNFGNRKPTDEEISTWLPYLKKEINIIKPRLICLMGSIATKALLGEKFSIFRDHGKIIRKDNTMFLIMPHPSAAMRFPKIRRMFEADMRTFKRFYDKLY